MAWSSDGLRMRALPTDRKGMRWVLSPVTRTSAPPASAHSQNAVVVILRDCETEPLRGSNCPGRVHQQVPRDMGAVSEPRV